MFPGSRDLTPKSNRNLIGDISSLQNQRWRIVTDLEGTQPKRLLEEEIV